jgi:hypothetical protein
MSRTRAKEQRMTEPTLDAAQQRLQRLLDQKAALNDRINRAQGQLRDRERKARTRRLIQLGGLVEIAAQTVQVPLTWDDPDTVLGVLLAGAQHLQDPASQHHWRTVGAQILAARATHQTNTVHPSSPPVAETESMTGS